MFGPMALASAMPNIKQTGLPEFAGAVEEPLPKYMSSLMLDLTTAVFLLRKSVEEQTAELHTIGKFVEWYLDYTFEDFNR